VNKHVLKMRTSARICLAAARCAAMLLVANLAAPIFVSSQERSAQSVPRKPVSEAQGTASVLASDIVSENLEHVAASATQILEVLNREAGLMVELKRLLAQDAGVSGQILEEADMTDSAVAERLATDLRARVLATHLLQRYGYLVPHVNPDSDLGTERKLELQERAQILARGSQGYAGSRENFSEARSTSCDPLRSSECPLPSSVPEGRGTLPAPNSLPARPSAPVQRASETPSIDTSISGLDRELPDRRSGFPVTPGTPAVLASMRPGTNSLLSGPPRVPAFVTGDNPSTLLNAQPDLQPASGSELEEPAKYSAPTRTSPAGSPTAEPVRMLRQPNPYANVPSLFDLYVQAAPNTRPLERFGLDVFRKGEINPAYLPMDLPVGPSYVVGPGDSLSIDLWGGFSQRLYRTVDREGRLTLPDVGPVLVSGRTLGDVQQEVQSALRTQLRDVSADVSLQKLRTVRVYVVGDVASPGAYDVSSLSTPLNALFAAGGVTPQGSLRHLQHFRGKTLVEEVDAYDLLLHGIRGDLQHLENGDSLLVPPLGPVVTVEGMVRRPALYELHGEKTLEDVLDLAGGILPAAALRHIEVQRLVAHEKRTMMSIDIGETSDPEPIRARLRSFSVQDGDEIHIFPIAPYNSSSIYLEGHVLRPGRYSYKPQMRLTDLVASYSDLLPEPSTRYAEIIRLRAPDYRPIVETFDLAAALEHPETAPKLEPLDTVRIFGRYDFEPPPEVLVTGEVRAPGRYRASGQEHLRDAVYQAGGLTPDAWLDSAQLFRRQPDGSTRVLNINLRDALDGEPLNNVLIQPLDRILVHRQPSEVSPASVYVRGDVARPGRYPLSASMRVSDLVRSAGGLLRSANPDSADLTHYQISSSSGAREQAGHESINLAAALAGSDDKNSPLRDGDVLTVPQQAGWKDVGAVVTLSGEVRKPGVYGIEPGERLSSLLKRAGGLLPTAYPRAAVFNRVEVHELQQKSRQELIQRVEQESTLVKTSVTTTGSEEAALQQSAAQQRQRVLDALRRAPISGRLVIHLRPDHKGFAGSPDDIELRAGDSLVIPKQPSSVLVIGQVYNSNALTYTPGKNAGWYLSRAGGPTQLANKADTFIIRADGSVTSGRQGGLWSGGVLSAGIGPGDTIVVPEKATSGGTVWKNLVAVAQIAQAGALAAAVAIP
jgi:polysaccharide export outer membrane protein